MAESMSGSLYREIPISSSIVTRWKEINVNTGDDLHILIIPFHIL
jgi:hypothetical protein